MAFPGLLLIICLWMPSKLSVLGALTGVMVSLTIAATALIPQSAAHAFPVMDIAWLEIVHERSQFLFLQLWTLDDWKMNLCPFISLTISALILPDPRFRKLCAMAMLVGATGLVIALIASLIGPIAILVQGQAWRWLWITGIVSVLVLAPTALQVWREARCGPLCAILIIAAWTFPAVDGTACIALALLLCSIRRRITVRIETYLDLTAVAVCVVVVVWIIANIWTITSSPLPESGREPAAVQLTRNILGVEGLSIILVLLLAYWILVSHSLAGLTAISTALTAISVFALPGALKDIDRGGTAAQIEEFSDWRNAIPPNSNVFVTPAHNSAAFAWFTLERPSYLSVDQSSGVVFSRATAFEVQRRSKVLLPIMDFDWQLLSRNKNKFRADAKSGKGAASFFPRPLTADKLLSLCSDPALNFIVAKENVGFDPIRHLHPGNWKDWNLYDCRRVNSSLPLV
jgi:hypothetical protein